MGAKNNEDIETATGRELLHFLTKESRRFGLNSPPKCLVNSIIAPELTNKIHSKLTNLDLSRTYLGVKGLACASSMLLHLPLLSTLSLQDCQMYANSTVDTITGNLCMETLCKELGRHPSLKKTDLRGNGIGTFGAGHLLTALSVNSRITDVDFSGNNITSSMGTRLITQLKQNIDGGNQHPVPVYDCKPLEVLRRECSLNVTTIQKARIKINCCQQLYTAISSSAVHETIISTAADLKPQMNYIIKRGKLTYASREQSRTSANTIVETHVGGEGDVMFHNDSTEVFAVTGKCGILAYGVDMILVDVLRPIVEVLLKVPLLQCVPVAILLQAALHGTMTSYAVDATVHVNDSVLVVASGTLHHRSPYLAFTAFDVVGLRILENPDSPGIFLTASTAVVTISLPMNIFADVLHRYQVLTVFKQTAVL